MSFVFGFLIYIFIFMYGSMVMRGVIEEKSNRIVEVIISSVKPFQLLIGKIIGVSMVGFTQFILWILLSLLVANIFETSFIENSQIGLLDNINDFNKILIFHYCFQFYLLFYGRILTL